MEKGNDNNKRSGNKKSGKKISAGDLLGKIKSHLSDEYIIQDKEEPENGISVNYFADGKKSDKSGEAVKQDEPKQLPEEKSGGESSISELYEAREAQELRKKFEDPDYDLMSIFGFEDEDKKESAADTKVREKRELKYREVDLNNVAEISAYTQSCKRRFIGALIAGAGTAMLLLISFIVENAMFFGLPLPSFLKFECYPQVAALLNLQVVLLAAAMQHKQFTEYIKQFAYGIFSPGQLYVLQSLALALYYITLVFVNAGEDTPTFNTVLMTSALLSLLYDLFDVSSGVYSFQVAASKNKKSVLLKLTKSEAQYEREALEKYLGKDESYFAVSEAVHPVGFAAKRHAVSEKRKCIKFMLAYVIVFSAVVFIMAALKGGYLNGAEYGLAAMIFTAPLSLFTVFGHARYSQTKKLHNSRSTVIGERAFDEFGKPSCIVLTDKEMFAGSGRIDVVDIHGFGDQRIDTALACAAAVFGALDCPLGSVFDRIASDYSLSRDVDIASVGENGIEAAVDGIGVLIGKYDYMKKRGVLPSGEPSPYEGGDSYLYIAVEQKAALRIRFRYFVSREFTRSVERLLSKDMNVVIRTFDPNINMNMLDDIMGIGGLSPVRVIKTRSTVTEGSSGEDSAVLASGGTYTLSKVLVSTKKVRNAMNAGIAFAWISLVLGSAITIALYAVGGFSPVVPLYLFGYQLFWLIPTFIIDRTMI